MSTEAVIRPSSREAILTAAVLLLAENRHCSMSEIAVRAGVGRATLHRHFRSRDDLIEALSIQSMDETEAAVRTIDRPGNSALQRLEDVFAAIIPLAHAYTFLAAEGAVNKKVAARYRRQLDWVRSLVEDLKQEGIISADIPTSWALSQIDQMVWTAWREVAAGRVAMDDATALAVRTLTTGLS